MKHKEYAFDVERKLTNDERLEFLHYMKGVHGADAIIRINEPLEVPDFGFKYEVAHIDKDEDKKPHNEDKSLSNGKLGYIYGDHMIVMQNRLLHAITNLDTNERRLIMYITHLVRNAIDIDENQRTFTVKATDFAKEYNKSNPTGYKTLEKIADSLLKKAFWFWDFQADNTKYKRGTSWVAECAYISGQGKIELTLTDSVTEMLTVFNRSNPFTKYERQSIVNLGTYGLMLFELISSNLYLKGKQKAYTVKYLREKFDCEDKYKSISDFKQYVLKPAIKEIKLQTTLDVSFTQNKSGREITEIVFAFKDRAAKNKEIAKIEKKSPCLNQAQANLFDFKLLAEHALVGDMPVKTNEEAKRIINRELQMPEHYKKYLPYLIKYGYAESKKS
uniref:replication initiation protein n=1 Tax=Psychrobacter sp. TaxID=56811 RepID=UPI0015991E49|nr:replication initiation protein [Psychrobacter sp.]QJS05425.1 replication protein, Rep3 superfamily [Psychrobacter sp.]